MGEKHRRYALSVIFSLLVSPEDDLYHYPATVETDQQDVGMYMINMVVWLLLLSLFAFVVIVLKVFNLITFVVFV